VSPPARDFVRSYFPGEYRIIPNGVDLSRFGAAQPFAPLRDGVPNLLFVGRPERRKGLGYLLRAYLRLRSEGLRARLIIVGAGRWESYQAFVARNALPDIIFAGRASAENLPRYMASADVICSPSTGAESFGMVVVEALASGRPLVASDIPGFRAVVHHAHDALLVPPKDPAALAAAVRRLLEDDALARSLGKAGVETAQRYAWPVVTRQLIEVYEEARELHNAQLAESERPRWGADAAWRQMARPGGA
jgi:phosphatidylinositol alpha-mannosyltransferase